MLFIFLPARKRVHSQKNQLAISKTAKNLPQKFNAERQLKQGSSKDLGRAMIVKTLLSRPRDQVKAVARPDTTSAALTLLQISLTRPNSRVIRHVVARRENLLLDLTAVNDKNNVIDCNTRLGDISAHDDLLLAGRRILKHL